MAYYMKYMGFEQGGFLNSEFRIQNSEFKLPFHHKLIPQ